MNDKLIKLMIFSGGAITGTLISAIFLKRRFNKLMAERIEELETYYEEVRSYNGMTDEQYEKAKTAIVEDKPSLDEVYNRMNNSLTRDSISEGRKRGVPERSNTPYHEMYKTSIEKRVKKELGIVSPSMQDLVRNVFDTNRDVPEDIGEEMPGPYDNSVTLKLVKKEEMEETKEEDDGVLRDAGGMSEQDWIDRRNAQLENDNPYVITSESYENDCPEYFKESLYYYAYDDVLCDSDQSIIEDLEDTVGWDIFEVLKMQTSGWVRNDYLSIDYEICVVKDSYANAVLGAGIALSPREKYERRKNRRIEDEEESD